MKVYEFMMIEQIRDTRRPLRAARGSERSVDSDSEESGSRCRRRARIQSLLLFYFSLSATSPVWADLAPRRGYVETCTMRRQRRLDEECHFCSSPASDPTKCERSLTGTGFSERCSTRSGFRELWCRALPPDPCTLQRALQHRRGCQVCTETRGRRGACARSLRAQGLSRYCQTRGAEPDRHEASYEIWCQDAESERRLAKQREAAAQRETLAYKYLTFKKYLVENKKIPAAAVLLLLQLLLVIRLWRRALAAEPPESPEQSWEEREEEAGDEP